MTTPTSETPTAGAPTTDAQRGQPRRQPVSPWLPASLGLVLVAAAVALQAAGIVQTTDGNWERGTLLAWLAIGSSVLAAIVGLAMAVLRRAWRLGLLVMVLALAANPYLLVKLFAAIG